jgi:polysaccharide biosynthesis/export protein
MDMGMDERRAFRKASEMRRVALATIAWGLLLAAFAGCVRGQNLPATQAQPEAAAAVPSSSSPEAMVKPHADSFVIGVDDVLAISVWKEDALSKTVPVRSDGKISLPLVGEVTAAGKTPLQLEGDISERLKNYITTPEVSVIVQEINSQKFNILGMVAKPGSYSLTIASTVVDAIATAGGFKDFAKQKSIYILRGQTRIPFNYKDFIKGKSPAQNVRLEPHDTIVVP